MKNLISILNLFLIPFLFSLFFTFAYADDNTINGTCPGEIIGEIDGTTIDTSHTENGAIGGGGNDRYRMTFPVAGTLNISAVNRDLSRNENYYFYVSDTSCGDWNVVNGDYGKSHSATVSVDAGDTITVRLQSISTEPNSGKHNYALSLDFTVLASSCTVRDSDTLSLADPVYERYRDNSDWNVRDPNVAQPTERFFEFTIDDPGDVEVTLSQTDQDKARFTIGSSPCPTSDGGLKNTTVNFSTSGILYVRVYYFPITGKDHNSIEYRLKVELTPQVASGPPIMAEILDQSAVVDTPFTALDISSYVTEPNGDDINYTATGLPPGLTIDIDTGIISGTPTATGTFNVTVTATDIDGSASRSFDIVVSNSDLIATPNTYNTLPGISIDGNFITDDTGDGADSGTNIEASTTATNGPAQGTVTISTNGAFTYTPDSNATETDTFVYTITDDAGNSATNTVTIKISTDFTEGSFLPFELINPEDTRNVIGNYQIAGNTVLCLTEKTSGYGGTCTDNQNHTSNDYVSKYLDIDNNGGTWNSTSSYINFDAPYKPSRGIIWAGLFWGGRIAWCNNNESDCEQIQYAYENGNSVATTSTGKGSNVHNLDISTTGATKIKLDIDNNGYSDILASKFHIFESNNGQTYAAYADVSAPLQSASLGLGKHTFTVANLTTMEGKEDSPGAFGGWSLVVIYAEDYTDGKPRNISIYNGFVKIENPSDPIEIAGFKLPTSGSIQSQLSVFSGEGEYKYGKNPTSTSKYDWMKISDQESSGYDYMPGKTTGTHLGNRDNMFDAQLDNILRDNISGKYNDLSNNNVGVDVDTYDVSDLMTEYRNNDENISSIYIKMSQNQDYITPSMMAFSAELYVPKLCYDYTLDIDGHVLDSVNNEIKTPFGGFGQDLTTVLYLKSLEGDIPLSNISANYRILDPSHLTYRDCTTEISETGEYDYSDACSYTYDPSDTGFSMYMGTGKTTTSGGIISASENRYIKFESEFKQSLIDTSFEFSVDYTVDYGAGAVPLRKTFTPDDLCDVISDGFLPELGYFNITDIANDIDEWNLYTQTSRRAFNLKLYAYDANNPTHVINNDLNLSVEVEMIRADNFSRDANTACNDEHSILSDVAAKFVHFNESKVEAFGYDNNDIDFAYRSTAMRIWYLTDVSGNGFLTDNHDCIRTNQAGCIELYNRDYTTGGVCSNECQTSGSTGNCYDCLRSSYGRKVCSRDNFSIRPESFVTQIYDSNQSIDTTKPNVLIANSIVTNNEFSLIAGYDYRFDINATNHVNDLATSRYRQNFSPGSPTHRISMDWFPNGRTVTGCNDVEDQNISLNLFDGSSVNSFTNTAYIDKVDQIGKYKFEVYDQNWTSADWDDSQMLHHTGAYGSYYVTGNDCLYNISSIPAEGSTDKQGCLISSVHENEDTGTEYKPLYARYHPYTFSVDGLTIGAGPGNDKNFVYINTLNDTLYPDGIDENMSYNIQGTFGAVGKDGLPVSNFVNNCYAESVDMSLYQYYNHTLPANTKFMTYDLIDHNTTNTNVIIRPREHNNFTQTNIATTDPLSPLVVDQGTEYFIKDMNGTITMDLGYNFTRQNDIPLNPRFVTMKDFNITYTTQPATVYVDLKTDYKIFGNKDIDQNITFLYARAKPEKVFYDDVTANNINTPVSIVVYCDRGYTECANRGILSLLTQTNEATWWKSWNHNNQLSRDGNIELLSSPASALNRTSASIIGEGEDKTINVSRGTATLPVIVPVDLVVNDPTSPSVPLNYTDRWLIYNPESANSAPSPFYRVRFIGGSGWAGQGDTGHVVGGTSNVKKNKRLEW